MTYKQIIFNCDVDCIHKNTEECFELECIYGQESILKQLSRKEQECKDLKEDIKDIANLLDLDTGEEYNFGNIELEIKQLKAKEQECEELKKQYNCYACGTCNGKEDYRNLERHHIGLRKSFDELHKQLDQLKAENENLKQYKASKQASYESMQREWNRAVNANRELKADNKHLNDLLNQALKELEQSREAIEKIKEMLIKTPTDSREHFLNAKSVILQICDEVK